MMKIRTSILLGILFASLNSGAFAISSVRMLGPSVSTDNDGTKPLTKSISVNGIKRTSVPALTLKPGQSVTNVSNGISTTNRLSMKPVKVKVKQAATPAIIPNDNTPSGNTPGGNTEPINAGIMEQLDILAEKIDNKVDIADLANYYTKPEIDDNYYTANEIDEKLADINTQIAEINEVASVETIQNLTNQITEHTNQIQNLQTIDVDTKTVYDADKDERVSVSIADNFSPSIFGITDNQGNSGNTGNFGNLGN